MIFNVVVNAKENLNVMVVLKIIVVKNYVHHVIQNTVIKIVVNMIVINIKYVT